MTKNIVTDEFLTLLKDNPDMEVFNTCATLEGVIDGLDNLSPTAERCIRTSIKVIERLFTDNVGLKAIIRASLILTPSEHVNGMYMEWVDLCRLVPKEHVGLLKKVLK